MVAGGGLDLANCTSIQANGHVFPRPDFSLFLGQNPQERTLGIRVEGSCDTVLLLKDGWTSPSCISDDADGSYHPPIRIPAAHEGALPDRDRHIWAQHLQRHPDHCDELNRLALDRAADALDLPLLATRAEAHCFRLITTNSSVAWRFQMPVPVSGGTFAPMPHCETVAATLVMTRPAALEVQTTDLACPFPF